jgi:Protein of unknown function (DUF3313)
MTTTLSPRHTARPATMLYSLTLTLALAAGGCASVGAPDRSSTLPRFEELSLQSDGTRSWSNSSARDVKAVRIDPQAISFGANVRIDDVQREALRNSLSQALTTQFSAAGMRVASASGDGADAMAVRATVTQVELANPVLNAVTTVLLFAPVSRGSLSVEIEGTGGPGSQRVAALAFSGTAGINNVGGAFSGLGHAKLQADIAAGKFVSLVTGVPPKAPAQVDAAATPGVQP